MRSVLAVASNTVKQALRMKIALVFIVLLLVLLPVMALSSSGDGTPKGRLQTFVSYGLSLTSFLLCLLTIFTAIHTTTSDIVHRQVYTVLTKPIRRYQYLLGKFAGILFLDLGLLVGFSAAIYAVTVLAPGFMKVSESQWVDLHDQFFTARARIPAQPQPVSEEAVEAEYARLQQNQTLDQYFQGASVKRIKDWIRKRMRMENNVVAPGGQLLWEFDRVRLADPNDRLFVRFKFDTASATSSDEQILGQWMVGDVRPLREGKRPNGPIYSADRRDAVRTSHEFAVPGDAIAKDGYLSVAFHNPPTNNTAVFFDFEGDAEDEEQTLVVMYKAGTFLGNYLRGVTVIFFRLVFLAGMALAGSTFLSFPVAVLLSLVVFFTVSISGFILDSFTYLGEAMEKVYGMSIEPIIKGLPQFDKYNPSAYLVDGRLLDWTLFHWASWTLVWALVLLGLGLWIFSHKELARDTS